MQLIIAMLILWATCGSVNYLVDSYERGCPENVNSRETNNKHYNKGAVGK